MRKMGLMGLKGLLGVVWAGFEWICLHGHGWKKKGREELAFLRSTFFWSKGFFQITMHKGYAQSIEKDIGVCFSVSIIRGNVLWLIMVSFIHR